MPGKPPHRLFIVGSKQCAATYANDLDEAATVSLANLFKAHNTNVLYVIKGYNAIFEECDMPACLPVETHGYTLCRLVLLCDVPAGTELRVSYGDKYFTEKFTPTTSTQEGSTSCFHHLTVITGSAPKRPRLGPLPEDGTMTWEYLLPKEAAPVTTLSTKFSKDALARLLLPGAWINSHEVDAIVDDLSPLASSEEYVAQASFFLLTSGRNRFARSYLETTLAVMRVATVIYLPVLFKQHWVLAVGNTSSGAVTLLDSLVPQTGATPTVPKALWKCLLNAFSLPWDKVRIPPPTWTWQGYTPCTQQPEQPPGTSLLSLSRTHCYE